MLHEWLVLIHELLAPDGWFFLHIGPNVSHYAKLLCDEIFGVDAFTNEIIWQRALSKSLMTYAPSAREVEMVNAAFAEEGSASGVRLSEITP
jgi:hypothetical protein